MPRTGVRAVWPRLPESRSLSVQRIWRAFGLQPHRIETFKLSTDPDFVVKVRDVVGLYVSPPEHAVVLCVDEKSQIHAWVCLIFIVYATRPELMKGEPALVVFVERFGAYGLLGVLL